MISLVDLQSALRLLSAATRSQSSKTDQTAPIAAPSETDSKLPISGAVASSSQPAFYNFSVTTTISIKDGVVTGSFQGSESGNGPTITDTVWYQGFQLAMSEISMTNQQLTNAVYSGAGLATQHGTDTFLGEVNQLKQLGDGQFASELVTALDSHTLQIQNAIDVQGLNYTSTSTSSWNGSSGLVAGSMSLNDSMIMDNADGKQHALFGLGSAELYLTW